METTKMTDSRVDSTYTTKDLYEASFLYAAGKKLVDLTRDGPQAWFNFEDEDGFHRLSRVFWSKEGSVVPKIYAEYIRSLKDMLFAQSKPLRSNNDN